MGAIVVEHEHPCVAVLAVEGLADIVFVVGPVSVHLAGQMIVGGLPEGVGHQVGAFALVQLCQCRFGMEAALRQFALIERLGDAIERNQAKNKCHHQQPGEGQNQLPDHEAAR
ncbi:hypothetical protein D3C80_1724830 [compost metagenome]